MGMLREQVLTKFLREQQIITPLDETTINSSSVDLRLGKQSYHYAIKDNYVLGDNLEPHSERINNFERYELKVGATAFIGINETIALPEDVMGLIFPRSSITRLGLEISPVYIQPGYQGSLPLTIINHTGHSVILLPGVRVAQLILLTADYSGFSYAKQKDAKYHQEQVLPSKLHRDLEMAELRKIVIEGFPFMQEYYQHE